MPEEVVPLVDERASRGPYERNGEVPGGSSESSRT